MLGLYVKYLPINLFLQRVVHYTMSRLIVAITNQVGRIKCVSVRNNEQ